METPSKTDTLKKIIDDGTEPVNVKFLKQSMGISFESLSKNYTNLIQMGQAIIDTDPEIDMEIIGKKLDKTHKLYLLPNGDIAYRVNMQQAIMDPEGNEKERKDLTKALSNISGESIVKWTGKKFPKNEMIRKLVFARKYQLRHINGLTYSFLYEMAKELHETNSLMLMGGGKGNEPLVITEGGEPYRGFLEGRIMDKKYCLLIHLSNMEIKSV
jgi:hypothetical protein